VYIGTINENNSSTSPLTITSSSLAFRVAGNHSIGPVGDWQYSDADDYSDPYFYCM
jgi:hypothetical protein